MSLACEMEFQFRGTDTDGENVAFWRCRFCGESQWYPLEGGNPLRTCRQLASR